MRGLVSTGLISVKAVICIGGAMAELILAGLIYLEVERGHTLGQYRKREPKHSQKEGERDT